MKKILTILFTFICSYANAEWIYLGEIENEKFYYEDKSIRRKGNTAKLWTLLSGESRKMIDGKIIRSTKTQRAFNCNSELSAGISYIWYNEDMGKGDVIWSSTVKDEDMNWKPVPPDTAVERVFQIACGN